MTRILETPFDISTYQNAVRVSRNMRLKAGHPQAPNENGGRIVEASWGIEYEDDGTTEKHPAEEVSFAERADGSWHKIGSLRLDKPRDEWPQE